MNLKPVFGGIWKWAKRNSTKLLAGGAITAEALGFYFMHREAPIVRDKLDELPEDAKWWDKVKVAGPIYLPAAGMLILSTGCIVGGCAMGERKAAIMASLYSASEASLRRLEKKVVEELGPEKAQELHDKAIEEMANDIPPVPEDIKLTGKGTDLCYEVMTGQWFRSSLAALKQDEADYRSYVTSNCWGDFNDWLECLGIERAGFGDFFGYNLDTPLMLKTSGQYRTMDGQLYFIVDYVNKPVMYNGKSALEFRRCEDCYPD